MDNTTRLAVSWANNWLHNPISDRTKNQYSKVMERLKKQIKQGVIPGSAKNRNTRSVERSAYKFWAANVINKNALKNPEGVKVVFNVVITIDKIANQAQLAYSTGKKLSNFQTKRTKRTSLRHLGPEWREKLIAASIGSMYEKEIRVMAICGCRPDEMEKGVTVKRLENTIEITIKGSKCSDKSGAGQEWRTLTFDANHPLILNISEGFYQAKARAIGDAVSHFGMKVSKSKKHPISAYSFRHAAASNFKASGLSDEEVAAALGHRSTATMSFYGSKSKGSGMLILKSVRAASPVRTPKKKSKPKLY